MDRYAVIGWPLKFTHSPRIHQLFAQRCDQELRYDAQPVAPQDLPSTLQAFAEQADVRGFNVTVPHKESVMAQCAALSTGAREAGAVNTVLIERGDDGGTRLLGHNTDGDGLVRDLTVRFGIALAGARVLMVGAGGAARGTCGPLLRSGCSSLHVVNRTHARAQALITDLSASSDLCGLDAITKEELAHGPAYDVVINATSAGLEGHVPDLPGSCVRDAFCYDMLYGDSTPFAGWAASEGARQVETGLGMLVEQAAEAFRLWRGVRPPTDEVYALLR